MSKKIIIIKKLITSRGPRKNVERAEDQKIEEKNEREEA